MDVCERTLEYSPSSAIGGDYQPFIDTYIEASARARARCTRITTLRYGELPGNSIDLALPDQSACPLLVFVHGGYWQELSKRESFFAADQFAARGIAYAAIDYTLAPAASVSQIVDECRKAIDYLIAHADSHGIDANRIFLAGSSAGAHLCAMCSWRNQSPPVAGVVLLSGIYDIEPLIGTPVNDALGLDVAEARRNSPLLLPVESRTPAIICWGQFETAEFKRQSRQMADKLSRAAVEVIEFEAAQRNHFDIVQSIHQCWSETGRRLTNPTRRCVRRGAGFITIRWPTITNINWRRHWSRWMRRFQFIAGGIS
jgi:arylformamidase